MVCFSLYTTASIINKKNWSNFKNNCNPPILDVSSQDILNNNFIVNKGVKYSLPSYIKGNILQYKKNSSNLTKNQRYGQIARGLWTNRTKTWASQNVNGTAISSNPNTSWLKREGNVLIGNIIENPYTNVVLKKTFNQECYSTTCSDVPGTSTILCWNDGLQTYYPRNRLTYATSDSIYLEKL